jgi:hypothetical protein
MYVCMNGIECWCICSVLRLFCVSCIRKNRENRDMLKHVYSMMPPNLDQRDVYVCGSRIDRMNISNHVFFSNIRSIEASIIIMYTLMEARQICRSKSIARSLDLSSSTLYMWFQKLEAIFIESLHI